MHAAAAQRYACAGDLFGHDRLILERLLAGTAVLLGHLDAEHTQLAELVVEIARRLSCVEPFVEYRDDLGFDERPQRLAKRLVILVENRATHRVISSWSGPRLSSTVKSLGCFLFEAVSKVAAYNQIKLALLVLTT